MDRSRDGQRVPKLHITNEDDLKVGEAHPLRGCEGCQKGGEVNGAIDSGPRGLRALQRSDLTQIAPPAVRASS